MSHQQQIDGSWRIGAAYVLAWALGLVRSLPPFDTQVSGEFLTFIPTYAIEDFVTSARLLPAKQINRARYFAEFWHWRSRTRQVIEEGATLDLGPEAEALGWNTFDDIVGFTANYYKKRGLLEVIDGDFVVFNKAYRHLSDDEWSIVRSITKERHFALNWLRGYTPDNQWDETPTNT
jgi:hypothetical protein